MSRQIRKHIAIWIAVITLLWLLRAPLSGEPMLRYGFLPWNVFLAAVPLLIEPAFSIIRQFARGWLRRAGQLLIAAVWLVFLPNAFYVLTDFMHLNPAVLVNERQNGYNFATHYARGDAIFLYDALLVFTATVFSCVVGGLALVHAYRYFQRRFGEFVARLAIGTVMLLVGTGVFIGRYGRWNSWDGLSQPWRVLYDLIVTIETANSRLQFITVLITIALLQLLSFFSLILYSKQEHYNRGN